MKQHNFLGIDIGATSGRALVGKFSENSFELFEILRFPNKMIETHGRLHWNVFELYNSIIYALKLCKEQGVEIESMGIDTWGVDFAYIGADGMVLGLPRAYRDTYTHGMPESFYEEVFDKETLYTKTGIQIMEFNSIFQLFAAEKNSYSPLSAADKILFIPDLLIYMLTGKMICEYTIASTSQLLNPYTKKVEESLLQKMHFNPEILYDIVCPGYVVGQCSEVVATLAECEPVKVVAVASHDTASAVAAVPAKNKNFAYLSSGTWSLMGIEVSKPIISESTFEKNFTNEGGIDGTIRFLKNITGMWILEECRREWERLGISYTYPDIVAMVEKAEPFRGFINPDDPAFVSPKSMTTEISYYCRQTSQPMPSTHAQYIRLIFESLALRYREVLDMLKELSPHPIETLHIIGGGAQNNLLNQFTASSVNLLVVAGPYEATAIGNIMVQAKSAGVVNDLSEMRSLIYKSVNTQTFLPKDKELWDNAYEKYKSVINQL